MLCFVCIPFTTTCLKSTFSSGVCPFKGELGFQLAKNLSANSKITSITILQDAACKMESEPFVSYASDIPDVRIVTSDLTDESMTADDMQKLLGERYDYVWDNASKGAVGAGKAVVDCAKAWNSKLLTYVSSAGVYQPDDVVSYVISFCISMSDPFITLLLFTIVDQ